MRLCNSVRTRLATSGGLLGMVMMMFLSHEIMGTARFLPLEEDEIPKTITQVFLHGVVGKEKEVL